MVLLCEQEIEKMLKQVEHLSTAGQLLLINVKMLSVDLDVFNEQIVGRLDTYIDLQTMLLKQARNDTAYHALLCYFVHLQHIVYLVRPMSHLQFYRATLSRDKIASVTRRVAHLLNSRATPFPNRAVLYSVQPCGENEMNADWSILVYATELQCATCTVAYCNFVTR